MGERASGRLFGLAVAAFLVLALSPLWSTPCPALQDYPEQLFHAHVLSARGDPALDYELHYEAGLRPAYSAFYLATLLFARFAPIEVAGRLALALYPLLIAVLVVRIGRRLGPAHRPWGALLLFPLAFHQQYFLGNVQYLLSLPLLLLALFDLEDAGGDRLRPGLVLRQVVWQVLLWITHPLTTLAYVALALVRAATDRRPRTRRWTRLALATGLALGLFAASALVDQRSAPPGAGTFANAAWLPPATTLRYVALMFTGMRWSTGPEPLAVLLWSGIAAVVAAGAWLGRGGARVPGAWPTFLALAVVALFALPFRAAEFSYVNVRVAAIAYFLAALIVAHVRLRGSAAALLVGLAALCTLDSTRKQARLSREIEEVLPVVRRIPRNARILPLVFEASSPELDPVWFQPHLHDHDYYHVLVGGGFSPYLLQSAVHPVRYKPGQERPAPGEFLPRRFTWDLHAADFEYFLVRGAPQAFARYVEPGCEELATSGRWVLFGRRR